MKINGKLILVHLGFWVLYIILWGVRDTAYAPTFWDTIDSNLIGSTMYAVGIYLNFYVLIPRLLLKRKQFWYVLAIIVLIGVMGYGGSKVFSAYYENVHQGTSDFFDTVQGTVVTAVDFLVVYALATCLYFINEWYVKERRLRELETQNLKAELALLKGQINPHFLFNALNSVHVLIRKNPEKAQHTLERFSELLSHQIYEVTKEKVALTSEVENLSNFIELQKMRFEDHTRINWQVKGQLNGKQIAPMLFLNFVENAFKYGEAKGDEAVRIDILLQANVDSVAFSCVNSVSKPVTVNGKLGVGIANVRRRLEILYPGKHQLDIERGEEHYSVNLELQLDED